MCVVAFLFVYECEWVCVCFYMCMSICTCMSVLCIMFMRICKCVWMCVHMCFVCCDVYVCMRTCLWVLCGHFYAVSPYSSPAPGGTRIWHLPSVMLGAVPKSLPPHPTFHDQRTPDRMATGPQNPQPPHQLVPCPQSQAWKEDTAHGAGCGSCGLFAPGQGYTAGRANSRAWGEDHRNHRVPCTHTSHTPMHTHIPHTPTCTHIHISIS